jgi:DNA (cytosine-5)-methyltransferase 1
MRQNNRGVKPKNNPKPNGKSRRFVSFFSGALGLDVGLQSAGLSCISVNDVDAIACSTIKANRTSLANEQRQVYECDIRDLKPEGLFRDLGVEREELFAVVGGPPCQAFSTAGRRMGLNDERGNVFLHFIDIIRGLRPKYAIFENVRGLLSAPLVHRPHDQRGSGHLPLRRDEKPGGALLHILAQLEEAGYATTFTLYNTANFGVPQIRERLIFFASREEREVPFMQPTHDEKGANGLLKWRTLREAIGHLQGRPCRSAKFPENRLKYYRLLTQGQNWRDLPLSLQPQAMGGSWHSGGGKTGFYRRLSWDKPAPTLVTRPTMPATDLCHPEELRPLSVEEYAAIQTFPSEYVFEGSLDAQYRQIGNAVPCLFGEAIGKHIIAFDEGRLKAASASRKLSRYAGTDHDSWREGVAGLQRQLVLYD